MERREMLPIQGPRCYRSSLACLNTQEHKASHEVGTETKQTHIKRSTIAGKPTVTQGVEMCNAYRNLDILTIENYDVTL
jgi:hypothetical protein